MSLCRSATRLITGMVFSRRHGPFHSLANLAYSGSRTPQAPIDRIEKHPYTGPRACSFRRFNRETAFFRQKSCSCAGRTRVVEIFGVWAGSSVVEHLTFNQVVDGSIPSRLTNKIGHLSKELFWQYLTGRKLVAVQVLCRPHYAIGPNRSI